MVIIHRISSGNVNCYIVVDRDKAILIDTSRKKYREKILDKCKEYHVSLIVLTHGHMDHCQNAAYLANALKIPVAMSKKDINMIPDNRKQKMSAKTLLGKIVLLVSLSSFEKDTLDIFEPMLYLQAGDNLNEYGVDAKVVELPGHTEGSIGLEIEGDKLFVGDALMNMFYPTISMLYTDKEKMLESEKRIGEMGAKTIYFGHGKQKRNRKWVK
ncbi:MAG: MBL fold metallo-hydrolase [Lachnospiraceae bacterium]|nr:MBL fold metallo-hydrolase [Lachnospiraceae bacterium]